ncbi:MAG: hypothetical protein ACP5JE_05990, partial [Thermoplasmata archaeon]
MITISQLNVFYKPPKTVLITWQIGDTTENINFYNIIVQHSTNEVMGFEDISGPILLNVNFYVHQYMIAQPFEQFYRLKITNVQTGEISYSRVQHYAYNNSYITNAIQYWETIYLKNLIQRPINIYFRIHSGMR